MIHWRRLRFGRRLRIAAELDAETLNMSDWEEDWERGAEDVDTISTADSLDAAGIPLEGGSTMFEVEEIALDIEGVAEGSCSIVKEVDAVGPAESTREETGEGVDETALKKLIGNSEVALIEAAAELDPAAKVA